MTETTQHTSKEANKQRKYAAINQYFDELNGQKDEILGKKVRRNDFEWCVWKTADKFFVSPSTVRKVINGWV